jgi:hypothetical protein
VTGPETAISPQYIAISDGRKSPQNPASLAVPEKHQLVSSMGGGVVSPTRGRITGGAKFGGGKSKGKAIASEMQGGIKKARFRPGMLALKEIKRMQAQTEAIIPRLPF